MAVPETTEKYHEVKKYKKNIYKQQLGNFKLEIEMFREFIKCRVLIACRLKGSIVITGYM